MYAPPDLTCFWQVWVYHGWVSGLKYRLLLLSGQCWVLIKFCLTWNYFFKNTVLSIISKRKSPETLGKQRGPKQHEKGKASSARDPRNNLIMDPNIWVGSSFCLLNPIVIKSACWCLWTQPDPKLCIISALRVLNNFFLNFLIILSIKILTIVIQLILIKNNRRA